MKKLAVRIMRQTDEGAMDRDAVRIRLLTDGIGVAVEQRGWPHRIDEVIGKLHKVQAQLIAHDGCPQIGCDPALDAEGEVDPQRDGSGTHLVAPIVRPRTMCRDTISAKMVTGSTITVPVAMILPQGSS